MRVLIASKILVVAAYRQKLEEMAAQPDIEELVAVTGPEWQEPGGRRIVFEESAAEPQHYRLHIEPIWFNGNYHMFLWPRLGRMLERIRPDLVHIDEEPYNLATAYSTLQARRAGARALFFTWQNLLRRYPPPFAWFERFVFRSSSFAIAGSDAAMQVLRAKGYCGPSAVIPQFGVDPELFSPGPRLADGPAVIGFVSRLVEEKGVLVLLEALSGLQGDWRLHVIGSGPLEKRAHEHAERLGIARRITWERSVPSTRMPERMRTFSVVVQPSLTRRHWKEQFGRAVMEAMACGVPVVGSDSAEIPNVIGAAGIVVPEADPVALREAIAGLLADRVLRQELAERSRARVLGCYTHRRIAEKTVAAYRTVVGAPASATIRIRSL
jgi:glycosyltransferase involved in cell wall biosynthesis